MGVDSDDADECRPSLAVLKDAAAEERFEAAVVTLLAPGVETGSRPRAALGSTGAAALCRLSRGGDGGAADSGCDDLRFGGNLIVAMDDG